MTDQPRTDARDTERNRGQFDPDATASSDQVSVPDAERPPTDAAHPQEPDARDRDEPDHRDREEGRSDRVDTDDRAELRERWDVIQTSFVDDPRAATAEADSLLRDTMERLIARWEQELSDVRRNWDTDEDRSTEDLRVTMRRYRDTLERLLSA